MARRIPDTRLRQVVDCAASVFIEQGYDRTQMADIARAAGLAKGTLYLYVESKEALFDFVLRHADDEESAPVLVASLPIRTPAAGATTKYVREELGRQQRLPRIVEALARRRVTNVASEIEGIVRELFRALARNRRRIRLIDRSAREFPEIAALWFEGARGGFLTALEHYLRDRLERGCLRSFPNVPAAARLISETTAFWAIHRHWDARPTDASEDVAEATVVHFVLSALTTDETSGPRARAPRRSTRAASVTRKRKGTLEP
jgi:AcrR family transcriptional regulator